MNIPRHALKILENDSRKNRVGIGLILRPTFHFTKIFHSLTHFLLAIFNKHHIFSTNFHSNLTLMLFYSTALGVLWYLSVLLRVFS